MHRPWGATITHTSKDTIYENQTQKDSTSALCNRIGVHRSHVGKPRRGGVVCGKNRTRGQGLVWRFMEAEGIQVGKGKFRTFMNETRINSSPQPSPGLGLVFKTQARSSAIRVHQCLSVVGFRHLTLSQWLPKPAIRWLPQISKSLREPWSPFEADREIKL